MATEAKRSGATFCFRFKTKGSSTSPRFARLGRNDVLNSACSYWWYGCCMCWRAISADSGIIAGQEQGLVAIDRRVALLDGVVHLARGEHGALDQFAAGGRICAD